MGSVCSVPMPFRTRQEEQAVGNDERGHISLIRQLSYDIYRIEGVKDSRDDLQEDGQGRRHSKRYYGVSKSMISRIHPQLPQGSTVASFPSASSDRMASFSDRTPTPQPPSTEVALEQLQTETSSTSSGASASLSDSSDFESNQSDQSPSLDLAKEKTLEEQLEPSEH